MKFTFVSYTFIGRTKEFNVKNLIGGQEIYLYDLVKFLVKKGHEIEIIQSGKKEEIELSNGIKIKKIGIMKRETFKFVWKNYVDKNSNIIHLHDFEDAFPFANGKVTGTCHGVTWDCPEKNIYWKVHNKYHKFLAKFAIRKLKKIASVDYFLLRFAQSEMPNYREKIEVIHSYVDTNLFTPKISGKSFRKKLGLKDKIVILFPRNLSYIRGIMLMLEAMKLIVERHPNTILLITGTGPMESEAKKFVKENKLERNVIFFGHKDHYREMPKIYAASDIVVIPSLGREGCSLSALEALAMKKPLVVTNVGGLLDIVIDSFNGFVAKTNYKDLSEKILYLLENKKEAKRVAQIGYVWVKKYFNYKVWCKKYEEFFEI